jgi:hypothetical protein
MNGLKNSQRTVDIRPMREFKHAPKDMRPPEQPEMVFPTQLSAPK